MENLIGQDTICKLLGYERPGDARRALEREGIKPFPGRPGFWFVTLDQLNAARGIIRTTDENHNHKDSPLASTI